MLASPDLSTLFHLLTQLPSQSPFLKKKKKKKQDCCLSSQKIHFLSPLQGEGGTTSLLLTTTVGSPTSGCDFILSACRCCHFGITIVLQDFETWKTLDYPWSLWEHWLPFKPKDLVTSVDVCGNVDTILPNLCEIAWCSSRVFPYCFAVMFSCDVFQYLWDMYVSLWADHQASDASPV